MASTLHPAFAKAIASRAVGYQRPVVAMRTFGFTVGGTSVPLKALLRMFVVDSAENVRAIVWVDRSELNQCSSFSNRLIGGFQELDHAKAGNAIVKRCVIVGDAIDKVREFLFQRLDLLELRRPHVA